MLRSAAVHTSMPEDGDIAAIVQRKIAAGTLPRQAVSRTWVGHGTGLSCEACDQQISSEDIENEVDLAEGRVIRMHHRCWVEWVKQTETGEPPPTAKGPQDD